MTNSQAERNIPIGGDFTTIFDETTFLSMVNSNDEATVALKFHLIMEEFINIWCAKRTMTDDLFSGADFVPFKLKLIIARNLGLEDGISKAFEKLNSVRNKYSHRLKHHISDRDIESLSTLIDNSAQNQKVSDCRTFHVDTSGTDQFGRPATQVHTWNSNSSKKLFIMCIAMTLRVTLWMQDEFIKQGITYTLTTGLPHTLHAPNS